MFGNEYPFIREVESPLTPDMLRPLDPRCLVVQFRSALTDAEYGQLGAFLTDYPDVPLRAYGGYDGSMQDLEFLRFFPTLKHFAVQVFEIRSIDGLRHLPTTLHSLDLGATRSRAFSLSALTRFQHLRSLHIEGHSKDFDSVGQFTELETLTLRSITLQDLSVLLPLRRLRSLDIKLGGTKDLRLLPEIGQLRYLELWMVRGLSDLAPIGSVHTLQYLFLQALRQVSSLPPLGELASLRRIHLETMKGLQDLTPLCTARALEELLILDMPQLSVDDLRCLTRISTLRRATVFTGRQRTNDAMAALLTIPTVDRSAFEFR